MLTVYTCNILQTLVCLAIALDLCLSLLHIYASFYLDKAQLPVEVQCFLASRSTHFFVSCPSQHSWCMHSRNAIRLFTMLAV